MKECANANDADRYLQWIANNWDSLRKKYFTFCKEKAYNWSDDIFSDTYLKIYEKILKSGINDNSKEGFDNYTFKSFKQNLQREGQYCRNAKRDANIDSDSLHSLYEDYYNSHNDSSLQKVKRDLYIDFATLYIISRVDDEFDDEHSYLFRIKHLCNLTYKELAKQTKVKGARQKVIDVKNWIKENITKEEINNAYMLLYGNLV